MIAKKELYAINHPDSVLLEISGPEIQELDNEIALLTHKLS